MNGSLFLEKLVFVWVQILWWHIPTKTKLEYLLANRWHQWNCDSLISAAKVLYAPPPHHWYTLPPSLIPQSRLLFLSCGNLKFTSPLPLDLTCRVPIEDTCNLQFQALSKFWTLINRKENKNKKRSLKMLWKAAEDPAIGEGLKFNCQSRHLQLQSLFINGIFFLMMSAFISLQSGQFEGTELTSSVQSEREKCFGLDLSRLTTFWTEFSFLADI